MSFFILKNKIYVLKLFCMMKKGFFFTLLSAGIVLTAVSISPNILGEVSFADTKTVQVISSLSQIQDMNGNYQMVENMTLDLEGAWTPIGTKDNPFMGTFDGNGLVVSNMSVEGGDYQGLFGYLDGATIKNIKFSKVDFSLDQEPDSEYFAGAIAGYATNGTKISNCEIDSGVNVNIDEALNYKTSFGGFVGSLVGAGSVICDVANYDSITITENMTLEYSVFAGGIVGNLGDSAKIENAVSMGNISVFKEEESLNAMNNIGGVVGKINGNNTKVTNIISKQNVLLEANGYDGVIAGYIATPVPTNGNLSNIAFMQDKSAFGYKNSYQEKDELNGDYVAQLPVECFDDLKLYFDEEYTYSPVESVEKIFLWNDRTLGWKEDVWVMNYSDTNAQIRLQTFQSFNIKLDNQIDIGKLLKCENSNKTCKYGTIATFDIVYEDECNVGYYNVIGVRLDGVNVDYEMIKNGDTPTRDTDVLLVDNNGSYTLKVVANSFTAGTYNLVLEAITFNGKLIVKDNNREHGSVKFHGGVSSKRSFTIESTQTTAEATPDDYYTFDHWNLYHKTTASEAYDDGEIKEGYISYEDEYWKNLGPIYSLYTQEELFRYAGQSLVIKFGNNQNTFILGDGEEEIKNYLNQDFLIEAVFEYDPYVISFNKINDNAVNFIEKVIVNDSEFNGEGISVGKNNQITISIYVKGGYALNERRLISSIQNLNQQPSVTVKDDTYENGTIYTFTFDSGKLDASKAVESKHNEFNFELAVNEIIDKKENPNLGWIIGGSIAGGVILLGGLVLFLIYYFTGFGGGGGGRGGVDKVKMKKDVKNEYKKYYY